LHRNTSSTPARNSFRRGWSAGLDLISTNPPSGLKSFLVDWMSFWVGIGIHPVHQPGIHSAAIGGAGLDVVSTNIPSGLKPLLVNWRTLIG